MDIVHDFFNQNGGGENLVKSIKKLSKGKIFTAFNNNKKNKEKFIFQSKINKILQLNVFFVFIYFAYFFKLHSKDIILFSGNHCCFSINRCVAKKKYLYAHSLPKLLFSELYIDIESNPIFYSFKKKLINRYYNNLINLDKIFFNSIKTKNKFLYAFPNLDKKVNLEVLYPFSDFEFIEKKESNTNKKNIYFVINSRHQSSKNIFQILLLIKPLLDRYKNIKLYITQEGSETKNLQNLYPENKQIIYTGYINFENYKKLLLNCTAVIFPSRDEDFGIAALDAYNLNVPVIIQRNCGFSEILHEEYKFFYNDNNFLDVIKKTLNQNNDDPYKNKINLRNIFLEKLQNI